MQRMAKQDDYVRYTVRLPADLYQRIQNAAGDKSVNAEIIHRLELSLTDEYNGLFRSPEEKEANMKRMMARLDSLLEQLADQIIIVPKTPDQ